MLCRMVMLHRRKKSGSVPVYLNVYDLTPINGYAYWFGLGIYHSGVQVHDVEYGFGAHDRSSTGIFEVEPKQCPGFSFRKSILIGRTDMDPRAVRAFMEKLADKYSGNSYHLISKNCNHFCNDVCLNLTGKTIPNWVNRLARIGFLCNCVLPAELSQKKVEAKTEDCSEKLGENKKLRNRSSRLLSSSSSNTARSPPLAACRPTGSADSSSTSSSRTERCVLSPTLVHDTSTSSLFLRL